MITPMQSMRLQNSHMQMQDAVRQVQRQDPNWRPTPSAYETVEGQIAANLAATREVYGRLIELQRMAIGPGPFAVESQPARSTARRWTAEEIRENNRIGKTYGCHTCGTKNPGTRSGNFVFDHQRANALIETGEGQVSYPHCAGCSARQGGNLRKLLYGR